MKNDKWKTIKMINKNDKWKNKLKKWEKMKKVINKKDKWKIIKEKLLKW